MSGMDRLTDELLERLAAFQQDGKFEYEPNDNYASRKGSPIQGHVIRYNPRPRKNSDGSTSHGFNFPALVASDLLGNADEMMEEVAEQLNACPAIARELLAHRRASQTAPAHEDDLAVDRFAAVMKAKLAKKRDDGRGGWSGPECSEETLSHMLRDHVGKGDPVDVANFAMMLHQRGERIAQAAPAPSDGLREENEPDYCFNPEDWEYTQAWDARYELAESILDYGRDKTPVRVSTLISGPDKWVARIPLDTDGDGEADDWEDQWFDSEEAARAALSASPAQEGGE